MTEEVFVVLTTWPDRVAAQAAARTIVEERLAACANLGPELESIYHWQGVIETSKEVPVLFKTTAGRYPELEARIKALHPYELPEILAIPPANGLPAYLRWVETSCAS